MTDDSEKMKDLENLMQNIDEQDDGYGADDNFDTVVKPTEIKSADKFVDLDKGGVVDAENLEPFDVIKAVAKQIGAKIRNPRKGCKQCYERGYIGRDSKTQMPIPCHCIYESSDELKKAQESQLASQYMKPNRKARRDMKEMAKKIVRNAKMGKK